MGALSPCNEGNMAEQYYTQGGLPSGANFNMGKVTMWGGGLLSLALIGGLSFWAYKLVVRDVTGIPVVQAVSGPMRVAPENPGGISAENQGLSVTQVAAESTIDLPEQVTLAPSSVALSENDLPRRLLLSSEQEAQTSNDVAFGGGTALSIQDLADQIIAGAEPLSGQATGPKTVKVQPSGVELALQQALNTSTPAVTLTAPVLRPRARPAQIQQASVAVSQRVNTASVQEISVDALAPGTALVQLGAFDSEEIARDQWQRMSAKFSVFMNDRPRVIQKAASGGRVFYRLRAAGFSDLDDARRFCATLNAGRQDCIPVLTR